MSRRLLNLNDLGVSSPNYPVENPMEMVKPKPVPVSNYIPNEPIVLTKQQWEFVCSKTHDASLPFTVQVTVMDKNEEDEDEGLEEVKEEEQYIPKRTKKSKK